MAKVVPRLSFHDDQLFGAYRTTATVYDATHISQQRKPTTLHEIDICVTAMDVAPTPSAITEWHTLDSAKQDLQEKIEEHEEKQAQQQQASNRQDLFARECDLLQQAQRLTAGESLFDYTLVDIQEMAAAKCSWLSSEYDLKETTLTETTRLLKANLLHELVLRDKHAKKIVDLEDRLEETYLDEYEKRGDRGVRRLNKRVHNSYGITQNPARDELMKKNSRPKKRGRIRDSEREKKPSAIELHRKEWATSKKTGSEGVGDTSLAVNPVPPKLKKSVRSGRPSLIFAKDLKNKKKKKKTATIPTQSNNDDDDDDDDEDDEDATAIMDVDRTEQQSTPVIEQSDKYKTFIGVLRMLHDNIQGPENYGYYLCGIHKLVEKARANAQKQPPVEWPMLELCEAILRMEQCLGIDTIESIALEPDEVYYCSYSGQRINSGDRVTHIRLLVRSHHRHNRWVIMKSLPDRKFEAPEFTSSVRAFFVKSPQCSLRGLVYRDFEPAYKAKYSRYFDADKKQKRRDDDDDAVVITATIGVAGRATKICRVGASSPCPLVQQPRLVLYTTDNTVWCQLREMCVQLKAEQDGDLNRESLRVKQALDSVGVESGDPGELANALRIIIEPYATDQEDRRQFLNKCIYLLLNIVDTMFKAPPGYDGTELSLTDLQCVTTDAEVSPSEALRGLINLSAQFRRCTPVDKQINYFLQNSRDITQYSEFAVRPYLFLAFFNYLSPS